MPAETLKRPKVNPKLILSALKAASDETRVRILHILSFGAFSVNEVVDILDMGQSRISRHLKILTDAGLIQSRREGSLVYSFLAEPNASQEGLHGDSFFDELRSLILSYKEDLPNREKDQKKVNQTLDAREKKTEGFFDRVAGNWESIQEETLHPKIYRSWIIENLPNQSEEIIDLGCGSGVLIPYLLPKTKHVIGVDSSTKMIEAAGLVFGKIDSVRFIQAQLESLPIPDDSCDAVVSSMVLHHISHPPAVIDEVHRVLRPEGIFCIVDLVKHNQEVMRDNFADLWLGFDPELLESWLTNAGFVIESLSEIQTDSVFKILTIKAKKKGGLYVHNNKHKIGKTPI